MNPSSILKLIIVVICYKNDLFEIENSFSWYWDECNHFEDDDRFALFVPLREATQDEIKNELDKVETSK